MSKPDLVFEISLEDIPDADLKGIGRVALAWSSLEGIVERMSWLLAGLAENHGLCLTTHTGIKQRYDSALALIRLEFPDSELERGFKQLESLITGELYGVRNEIVHSRMAHFAEMSLRRTYKARGRLKKTVKPIKAEDYTEAAGRIVDAANKALQLLHTLYHEVEHKRGAPPPWPDTI